MKAVCLCVRVEKSRMCDFVARDCESFQRPQGARSRIYAMVALRMYQCRAYFRSGSMVGLPFMPERLREMSSSRSSAPYLIHGFQLVIQPCGQLAMFHHRDAIRRGLRVDVGHDRRSIALVPRTKRLLWQDASRQECVDYVSVSAVFRAR